MHNTSSSKYHQYSSNNSGSQWSSARPQSRGSLSVRNSIDQALNASSAGAGQGLMPAVASSSVLQISSIQSPTSSPQVSDQKKQRPQSSQGTSAGRRFFINNGGVTARQAAAAAASAQAPLTQRASSHQEQYVQSQEAPEIGLGALVDDRTYLSVLRNDILSLQRRLEELKAPSPSSSFTTQRPLSQEDAEQRKQLEEQLSLICCSPAAIHDGSSDHAKVKLFEILTAKMSQLGKELIRRTDKFSMSGPQIQQTEDGLSRLPQFMSLISRFIRMKSQLEALKSAPPQPVPQQRMPTVLTVNDNTALLTQQLQQAQETISKQTKSVDEMQAELTKLRAELATSKSDLRQAQQAVRTTKDKYTREKDELVRVHIVELESLQKLLEDAKAKGQFDMREYQMREQELREQIAQLRSTLDQQQSLLSTLRIENDDLVSRYNIVIEEREILLKSLEELKAKVDANAQRQLEQIVVPKISSTPSSPKPMASSARVNEENARLKEEISAMQLRFLSEKETILQTHRDQEHSLLQKVRELEAQLQQQRAQQAQLVKEHAEEVQRINMRHNSELSGLNVKLVKIGEDNKKLEEQLANMRKRKDALNEKKLQLESELAESMKKQGELEKQIKKNKSEIARLLAVESKYVEIKSMIDGEDGESSHQQPSNGNSMPPLSARSSSHDTGSASSADGKLQAMKQYMAQVERNYEKLQQEALKLQEKVDQMKNFERMYAECSVELERERTRRAALEKGLESIKKDPRAGAGLGAMIIVEDGSKFDEMLLGELKTMRAAFEKKLQEAAKEIERLRGQYENQVREIQHAVAVERQMHAKKVEAFANRCMHLETQLREFSLKL